MAVSVRSCVRLAYNANGVFAANGTDILERKNCCSLPTIQYILSSPYILVSEILQQVKRKTDLINVQGNIDISIIEPVSDKLKIRLRQ